MQYTIIVDEDDGRGTQTLSVTRDDELIARIHSMVSGVICNVYIPPDSEECINAEPLSRDAAVRLANEYEYTEPTAKKKRSAA